MKIVARPSVQIRELLARVEKLDFESAEREIDLFSKNAHDETDYVALAEVRVMSAKRYGHAETLMWLLWCKHIYYLQMTEVEVPIKVVTILKWPGSHQKSFYLKPGQVEEVLDGAIEDWVSEVVGPGNVDQIELDVTAQIGRVPLWKLYVDDPSMSWRRFVVDILEAPEPAVSHAKSVWDLYIVKQGLAIEDLLKIGKANLTRGVYMVRQSIEEHGVIEEKLLGLLTDGSFAEVDQEAKMRAADAKGNPWGLRRSVEAAQLPSGNIQWRVWALRPGARVECGTITLTGFPEMSHYMSEDEFAELLDAFTRDIRPLHESEILWDD